MNTLQNIRQFLNRSTLPSSGRLYFASILVGIIAGLGAILFFTCLGWLTHLFLHQIGQYYPPEPAGEQSGYAATGMPIRWGLIWLIPAIGGLLSGLLVFLFAPEAEGHGTDAVIEAFHHKRGLIRKRVPMIKTLASIITIGTGGSAGREGPIAQIGAGFGSYLASILRLTDDERRILLVSGAAGGVGAIFRSPLGGALFAVEVLYKRDFEARALIPALISSIVAYSIFASIFGWELLFKTPAYVFREPLELPFYAGLGLVCALVGLFYIKVFYGLRDRLFRALPLPQTLTPAVGGLLIGGLGIFAPHVLASGYGYLQQAMDGSLTLKFMFMAAVLKILATSFTISSGGSGGVFAPSLFIGGMLGGSYGALASQLFPDAVSQPNAFVLVGMGAFFAGVAKVPISSMIMVSEMTGGYQLLVPMMLASATAYVVTSRITLYEKQVNRMADSPAHMGDFTVDVLDTLSVEEAYRSRQNVPVIEQSTPLLEIQHLVSQREENQFPVVDKKGSIVGILSMRYVRSVLFEEGMGSFLIVQDLMTKPVTVTPAESLRSALKKFIESEYDQIPVVDMRDESRILGLISYEDIIETYNREVAKRKAPL